MVNKKITIILTILFLIMFLGNIFAFNLFRPSTWFKSEPKTVPGFGPFDGFGGGRSGGGGAGGSFGDEPVSNDTNTIIVNPDNLILLIGGTCPGFCADGFSASNNYPRNLTIGNIKYNGSGAICYSCLPGDSVATRCDPRNGSLLGTVDLSTAAGQIIKSEICPDITIDIDVPYPNIEDLPLEEITLPPVDMTIKPVGEIYKIGPGSFDCSVTERSTIQERLNLTYSNNNALYRVNDGTRNDVIFNYSASDINITLNKNRFTSKYYFTQEKDYATACFIENITEPELLANNKRFVVPGSAEIINGNVIAKLRILPDGKRLEICINRPINALSDSEKTISNMPFMSNNVKKIFTIKQKRTLWFSKKIKDISFTLNVELDPFGCTSTLEASTPVTSNNFFNALNAQGSCYNPQGTASTGLTGKSNYEKFGFDKQLFIYDIEGIKHNYCDYGDKYCDQDQLKVALLKKAELMKEQKTIILDGIIFAKSEDNKIEKNTNIYLTDEINKINADNLISSDFTYSENPEEYLNTLITQLNKIPEELRKFVILDLTFTNKYDSTLNGGIEQADIVERVNRISGNSVNAYLIQINTETNAKRYLTNPMRDIYSYQITVDSFLRNQEEFKTYLSTQSTDFHFKSKNIVFLKQLIENTRIYYGDSVSPVLVNAKTYGSLDSGLTRDIFTSVQFMNESNKPITLLSDSEVKAINAPGLYLYELILENDTIKYKVKNTTQETKNFLDYYNMNRYQEYKQNLLFTNPINAIYKNYSGIPFKYNDSDVGLTQGNATVYSDYTNWDEVQNGYILEVSSNNSGIENISFKNIRPLYIQSNNNYSYKYLKPNGRYSDNVNKTVGKETVFVFLDYTANNPQFVIESTNDLILNIPIAPQIINNTKKYNVLNDLRTPNQTIVDFDDLYSGIETANVGYMLTLIKQNQVCFNFENNKINFWLNPEKMLRNTTSALENTSNTVLNAPQNPLTTVVVEEITPANTGEWDQTITPANISVVPTGEGAQTISQTTNTSVISAPTYQISGNFLVVKNTSTINDNYILKYSETNSQNILDWSPASYDREFRGYLINITNKNKMYFRICSVTTGNCSSIVEYTRNN